MVIIRFKLVSILTRIPILILTIHPNTLTLVLVEEMVLEAEVFVVAALEEEEDVALGKEVFSVKSAIRLGMMLVSVTIGSLYLLSMKDMATMEEVLEVILEVVLVDMALLVAMAFPQMSGCKVLHKGILQIHSDLPFLLNFITLDLPLLKLT